MKYLFHSVLALAAGTAAFAPPEARAEVDFSGKTVEFYISSRAGGGSDALARILGDGMSKYLPGNPSMLYRNDGAGFGTRILNKFGLEAKPNGLTVATGSGSQTYADVLRRKTIRYKLQEFEFISHLESPTSFFIVNRKFLDRFHDKSKTPIVMGGTDGTRGSNQMAVWGPEYAGWNLRWVVGYQGTSALHLAFDREESQATGYANMGRIKEWVDSGRFEVVAQTGLTQNGKVGRHPTFPDVPLFQDLVEPNLKTDQARSAYNAWLLHGRVGKWYALPPKTPADIVEAYRTAFAKALADKQIDERVRKIYSPYYSVDNGPETLKLVEGITRITDGDLAFIDNLRAKVGIPAGVGRNKMVRARITAVKDGGGEVSFKVSKGAHSVMVSDSGTLVTVADRKVARAELKEGMTCRFIYPDDKQEAKSVVCD